MADILQAGRSSVFAWQAMYRAGGFAALLTKFASGRPTTLSDEQMVKLYALIVGSDLRKYSFGVALWIRKLVGDLIFMKFQGAVVAADDGGF